MLFGYLNLLYLRFNEPLHHLSLCPLIFLYFYFSVTWRTYLKTFHLLLFNFLLVGHPFLPLLLFFPLIISSVLAFCHLYRPPLLFTANYAFLCPCVGLWEGVLMTIC